MALTLQDGTFVWQKVKQALTNANPAIQGEFKALREWLVSQKGNPQLQFISFGDGDIVTNTGYSPIGVASTFYGVYFIKNGTGTGNTTACWLTLGNEATNTTLALKLVALHTAIAGQEISATYPNGKAFGTDFTISGEDASLNGTEVAGGAAGSGFVILGAA